MLDLIFGVYSLDYDYLINTLTQNKNVDLSRLSMVSFTKYAYENGFKHVELTLDMRYIIPGSYTENIVEELKDLSKELGVSYSVHLPLWSVEPSSPNPYIRNASTKSLIEVIQLSEPLKPTSYVIHATGALASEFTRLQGPPLLKKFINEMFFHNALLSLKDLIKETGIDPAKLAIETVEFEFKYTRKLAEEIGASICFDTGHVLAGYSGNYDVMELLESTFDRVIEIHLHDGYRENKNGHIEIKDHLPLGEGKLPTCKFLSYLIDQNFKGPIVIELPMSLALKSISYIKETCKELSKDLF